MGRRTIYDTPMTAAERQDRRRWKLRMQHEPQTCRQDASMVLDRIDAIPVLAADKLLAELAREIAKRRKRRAKELAAERNRQRSGARRVVKG
jgi:hypothetical protein